MIDLRSDSLTLPDDGMRAAMAAAEIGDDVYGEDPTVRRLEKRCAEMLGQEAALFLPTGTMGNLIAIMTQTKPGDSVLISNLGHSLRFEGGGMAEVAGVLPVALPGPQGKFDVSALLQGITQIDDPHFSRTTLCILENTTNWGGGAFYTLEEAQAFATVCRERGLRIHCDGARLWNGIVAGGVDAAAFGKCFDSVMFSFSKGLGCPAGAMLAGSRALIHEARRKRKMLGGGMRQSGVLAACALHALDKGYIDDLGNDHSNAAEFRSALEAAGIAFPLPSPTNIVYINAPGAFEKLGQLGQRGILALPRDPQTLRVMFHRGVTAEDTRVAIEVFREVLS